MATSDTVTKTSISRDIERPKGDNSDLQAVSARAVWDAAQDLASGQRLRAAEIVAAVKIADERGISSAEGRARFGIAPTILTELEAALRVHLKTVSPREYLPTLYGDSEHWERQQKFRAFREEHAGEFLPDFTREILQIMPELRKYEKLTLDELIAELESNLEGRNDAALKAPSPKGAFKGISRPTSDSLTIVKIEAVYDPKVVQQLIDLHHATHGQDSTHGSGQDAFGRAIGAASALVHNWLKRKPRPAKPGATYVKRMTLLARQLGHDFSIVEGVLPARSEFSRVTSRAILEARYEASGLNDLIDQYQAISKRPQTAFAEAVGAAPSAALQWRRGAEPTATTLVRMTLLARKLGFEFSLVDGLVPLSAPTDPAVHLRHSL